MCQTVGLNLATTPYFLVHSQFNQGQENEIDTILDSKHRAKCMRKIFQFPISISPMKVDFKQSLDCARAHLHQHMRARKTIRMNL